MLTYVWLLWIFYFWPFRIFEAVCTNRCHNFLLPVVLLVLPHFRCLTTTTNTWQCYYRDITHWKNGTLNTSIIRSFHGNPQGIALLAPVVVMVKLLEPLDPLLGRDHFAQDVVIGEAAGRVGAVFLEFGGGKCVVLRSCGSFFLNDSGVIRV